MRKAPMLDCDNLEEGFSVVPGEFFVYLHPGHSFKHHNHVVGTDMTPYVLEFWDKWYPGQVVYTCEGVEDDLLASIRNDPGVDGVECVIEPGGIPSEEPDTLRHSALTNEFVEL
jgi:hypothetical protein